MGSKMRFCKRKSLFKSTTLSHQPSCVFYKTFFKKSIDDVLGIRTRGGRMEGANESTEQWWHPHI